MELSSGSLSDKKITYREIPVENCLIDKSLELRFEYIVDELADDIKAHGQLQPVLSYMKNSSCYIFAGVRRYYAIKKLYENYGEPKTIKTLIFEREPSEREKLEIALSENLRRDDFNIYEKIAFVLLHMQEADDLSGIISKHFVREVKTVMSGITVGQLKRWYSIEKVLGGVRLKMNHLKVIAQLDQDEQDYAVFFFHVYSLPEDLSRFDLRKLFMNTALTSEQKRKLSELGIKNPFEREVPDTEAWKKKDLAEEKDSSEKTEEENEKAENYTHSFGESISHNESNEDKTQENTEEETNRTIIMTEKIHALVSSGRVYVLYTEAPPEVEMKKVEDGQVISIDDLRYRVRILA